MRLLLDTQVVLWHLGGERSLSPQATEAIAAADDLLFSAVSYAEIGIKTAVGKQWGIEREFNRRLKRRFEELGIERANPAAPAVYVAEARLASPASGDGSARG